MTDKNIKLAENIIIGADQLPFVIAEIGSNHNQNLGLARELIRISAECGAGAVKFQSLNLNKQYVLCRHDNKLKDLYKQIELQEQWYPVLADEASKAGVLFCSAPTYLNALPILEAVNASFYKLGSPQIRTFPTIIREVALLGKPVIMSTGYCSYAEIERAVEICESAGNNQFILLHCVSEYPTRYEQVNLRTLTTLQRMFNCLVGLSDHTAGHEVPGAAVALGAVVIEKHITMDRNMKGPDHHFALEPAEFKRMVQAVQNVYKSLGSSRKSISTHEKNFAHDLLVCWLAGENIKAGETITENKIVWLRSKQGISDENYRLLGKITAVNDIGKGTPIKWENIRINKDYKAGF